MLTYIYQKPLVHKSKSFFRRFSREAFIMTILCTKNRNIIAQERDTREQSSKLIVFTYRSSTCCITDKIKVVFEFHLKSPQGLNKPNSVYYDAKNAKFFKYFGDNAKKLWISITKRRVRAYDCELTSFVDSVVLKFQVR